MIVALLYGSHPINPDEISVTRYSFESWSNVKAQGETVSLTEDTLTLQPGSWIYVVDTVWVGDAHYGGRAEYVFVLDCTQ